MSVFRRLVSMISTLMVIAVTALAILLVGVRVIGLTPYTVLSGSMEPTYPVGAMIYVRQIDAQDIQVGMPLTFRVSGGAMVATHRVHELTVLDGETHYVTKGDANDMPDQPIGYDSVIGAPVFSIPFLGYVSTWLQSGSNTVIALIVVVLAVLLGESPKPKKARA